MEGDHHLLPVVQTVNLLRLGFRLGQRRKQHRRENRDDRDHDEQFDERERSELFADVFHNSFAVWFLTFRVTVRALYGTRSQSQPVFKNFFSTAGATPVLLGKTSDSRATPAILCGIFTRFA
jgi:hypothetical protein